MLPLALLVHLSHTSSCIGKSHEIKGTSMSMLEHRRVLWRFEGHAWRNILHCCVGWRRGNGIHKCQQSAHSCAPGLKHEQPNMCDEARREDFVSQIIGRLNQHPVRATRFGVIHTQAWGKDAFTASRVFLQTKTANIIGQASRKQRYLVSRMKNLAGSWQKLLHPHIAAGCG